MRTASAGGIIPSRRMRRTFDSDAVSTSIENVDSGAWATDRSGLSARCSYSSPVGIASTLGGGAIISRSGDAIVGWYLLGLPQPASAARATRADAGRVRTGMSLQRRPAAGL